MFAPANETHFALTIEGLSADFQVFTLQGREAISQPFVFEVELVSEQPSLDLETLLHKPAFLQLSPDGSGIHGQIYRAAQGDSGKRLTRYSVTLRPQLSYLAHRVNQRIFQNLTVPKIIGQVLEEHGIQSNAYEFKTGSIYPERIYCVQYDESDLHFIQRLCEEEGIHYHFQHSATAHQLVFGDDQTVFPKLKPVAYQPRLAMETREVRISGSLGDTITQDGISQLVIDLPGAAPGAAQIDLSMSGNLTPVSAGFGSGTRGAPTDIGASWLNGSLCTWIPVDAGQGLRLSGSFPQPLTRLTLRLCYLSPVALLAGVGATIGGAKGISYTLSPNGGLLSPDGEIITLRPGEPTPELDRAIVHRIGPEQNSSFLSPKDKL